MSLPARTVALASGAAIIVGSIGPWWSIFLGDVAGTKGDGKITLALGFVGALLVLTHRPPSRLLLLASAFGVLAAGIGLYDLLSVNESTQELFGQEVDLIDPAWGLWLTIGGGVAFTISAFLYRREEPESE